MTNDDALEILKKESGCRHTTEDECWQFDDYCNECPYNYDNVDDRFLMAIDKAIEIMEGKNDE